MSSLKYKWLYNFDMAQITIYLDDEALAAVNAATESAHVSKSQWIAESIPCA